MYQTVSHSHKYLIEYKTNNKIMQHKNIINRDEMTKY